MVKLLVKKGCSVDARNEGGETPLHLSGGVFKSVGVAMALLRNGGDINARDQIGPTPLHHAAMG